MIQVEMFMNALITLAMVAGVLGIGFKAVNGRNNADKKTD